MEDGGVPHAHEDVERRNVTFLPGPVPFGEHSGEGQFCETGGEEEAPIEAEQVVPLHPRVVSFDITSESACREFAAGAARSLIEDVRKADVLIVVHFPSVRVDTVGASGYGNCRAIARCGN